LAFLATVVRQEVVLAPAASAPLRLTFNLTLPRMPCHLLRLDYDNAAQQAVHNLTAHVARFRTDAATGRALALVALGDTEAGTSEPRYGESEGDVAFDDAEGGIRRLTEHDFGTFTRRHPVALVAFGAPWCPYTRRLAPVWAEVAMRIGYHPDVRLGWVDCTQPAGRPLCIGQHVQVRVGTPRRVIVRPETTATCGARCLEQENEGSDVLRPSRIVKSTHFLPYNGRPTRPFCCLRAAQRTVTSTTTVRRARSATLVPLCRVVPGAAIQSFLR
jgi:thiol-disulfide isomerase/thioredoxin